MPKHFPKSGAVVVDHRSGSTKREEPIATQLRRHHGVFTTVETLGKRAIFLPQQPWDQEVARRPMPGGAGWATWVEIEELDEVFGCSDGASRSSVDHASGDSELPPLRRLHQCRQPARGCFDVGVGEHQQLSIRNQYAPVASLRSGQSRDMTDHPKPGIGRKVKTLGPIRTRDHDDLEPPRIVLLEEGPHTSRKQVRGAILRDDHRHRRDDGVFVQSDHRPKTVTRYGDQMGPALARARGIRQRLRRRFVENRQPQTAPPDIPTRLPDFVGIGAQKAGTSWWYALITAHPHIDTAYGGIKEVNFFEQFWNRSFTSADAARYGAHFTATPGHLCGEWTPEYLFDPWTAPLLATAAPDTRLLVIVRDPVDRYRSGLTHLVVDGKSPTPQDLRLAFYRGRYLDQLKQFTKVFSAAQLLVLQYERCVRDPRCELRRTYEFLGVDASFVPDRIERLVNATEVPYVVIDPAVAARLADDYRADNEALAAEYPGVDLSLWTHSPGTTRRLGGS